MKMTTKIEKPKRNLPRKPYFTKAIVREKLKEIYAPFDPIQFFDENVDLMMKFLHKKTLSLVISEDSEIPEEFQYKNIPTVLSSFGEKHLERTLLQKLEWLKCALDPIYYFKKYVNIVLVSGKIVKFQPTDYQLEMVGLMDSNRYTIACWARQIGKSTIVSSYFLWVAHFQPGKQCAILANKASVAQEMIERLQTSYELMPTFMKPGVRVYNKRSVKFANKAKVSSSASSKSAVRGSALSMVLWDEAGHTANDVDFYSSIYSTISSGDDTKLIVISTPNGKRGVFYKLWSETDNGFVKTKAIWSDKPGRDETWKESTIKATSKEQFAQEHECVFSGSQNSLVSSVVMEVLVHAEPEREFDSGLKVYKHAEENHIYCMCVDVSRGVGGDYHAFSMIDITDENKYEVVCTFRNNILSPLIYPTLIHNVATQYNQAYVLIEVNDIGEQVANDLYYDLEYENVLMTFYEKKKQTLGFSGDAKPGVRTTQKEKGIGCSNLKTFVEKDKITLNDPVLIDELGNFVPHGKSFAAASGSHDDLIMTLVIFSWAVVQPYFKDLTDKNIREKLVAQQEDVSMSSLVPFGIIETEHGEYAGDMTTELEDDMRELMKGF